MYLETLDVRSIGMSIGEKAYWDRGTGTQLIGKARFAAMRGTTTGFKRDAVISSYSFLLVSPARGGLRPLRCAAVHRPARARAAGDAPRPCPFVTEKHKG